MSDNLHKIFSGSECPPHSVLRDYFLRKLTDEEMHQVEQHLVDCEMCSDELEGLSRMKDLRDLDYIVEEINVNVRARPGRILGLRKNYALMAAAALVVLLAGTIVVIRIMTVQKPEQEMSVMTAPSQVFHEEAPPAPRENGNTPKVQEQANRKKPVEKPAAQKVPVVVADEAPPEVGGVKGNVESQQDVTTAATVAESEVQVAMDAVADTLREQTPVLMYTVPEAKGEDRKLAREIAGTGSKKPEVPATLMDVAMAEFMAGHYEQASVFFEQVTSNDPGNHKAAYHLAVCYYNTHELKKASRLLKHILRSPGNPYYEPAQELMNKIRDQ